MVKGMSYCVWRTVPIWSKPVTSRVSPSHRWHFPAHHLHATPDRGGQESDRPTSLEKSKSMVGSAEENRLESRRSIEPSSFVTEEVNSLELNVEQQCYMRAIHSSTNHSRISGTDSVPCQVLIGVTQGSSTHRLDNFDW